MMIFTDNEIRVLETVVLDAIKAYRGLENKKQLTRSEAIDKGDLLNALQKIRTIK